MSNFRLQITIAVLLSLASTGAADEVNGFRFFSRQAQAINASLGLGDDAQIWMPTLEGMIEVPAWVAEKAANRVAARTGLWLVGHGTQPFSANTPDFTPIDVSGPTSIAARVNLICGFGVLGWLAQDELIQSGFGDAAPFRTKGGIIFKMPEVNFGSWLKETVVAQN